MDDRPLEALNSSALACVGLTHTRLANNHDGAQL